MPRISALLYNPPLTQESLPLPKEVSCIKVCANISDIPKWFEWGKKYTEKQVVFSIPNTKEPRRKEFLEAAASIFDFVELNADSDADFFKKIPLNKRVIFLEKSVNSIQELTTWYKSIQNFNGRHYEIATKPNKAADLLLPILFQKGNANQNLSVYASGFSGMWTQILGAYLGAEVVYGHLYNNKNSYFKLQQLLEAYHLPYIKPVKEIYGIIGNPVLRSFSPKIHNGAYKKLGVNALYLPFQVTDFEDFWQNIIKSKSFDQLGITIKGLTCVSPFKAKGIEYTNCVKNPLVSTAKAGNLLVKINQKWVANTTDSLGVLHGLNRFKVDLKNINAAIIGCGGAGRTIACALKRAGAKVTLVNRSLQRGEYAAQILSLPFLLLKDLHSANYNLLVNATPVGKKEGSIPFEIQQLTKDSIVVDMVYRKDSTLLIQKAQEMGLRTIDGFDILGKQVQYQFIGMTQRKMPESLAYELAKPENTLMTIH